MAAPDLVKSLNNRSRVCVKLDKLEQAEIDASEVRVYVQTMIWSVSVKRRPDSQAGSRERIAGETVVVYSR